MCKERIFQLQSMPNAVICIDQSFAVRVMKQQNSVQPLGHLCASGTEPVSVAVEVNQDITTLN